MSEYVPTTADVRRVYCTTTDMIGYETFGAAERAEFDRWLAKYTAEKRAEWEAEQGDKPAPCVMTHTPPFNFAQCETHDETFPLGGACKWHGKESIYEVLEGETDEQRMRAVRAEQQLEILRAEQGETEWEYGSEGAEGTEDPDPRPLSDDSPYWPVKLLGVREPNAEQAAQIVAKWNEGDPGSARLIRRRKAGPWLPVPGPVRVSDSPVRDSDSEESEGKA